MVTQILLDSWLGKGISEICANKYNKSSDNHCAHFVSHVLALSFGYTCKSQTGGKNTGANLRVHEVFARCASRSEIIECSTSPSGLIFVSASTNFVTKNNETTLNNVPRKHIGVLNGGVVWHYFNTQNKVIKQNMSDFLNHYSGQTNSLWLGSWPPGIQAVSYSKI